MAQIVPAILTSDPNEAKALINSIEGKVERVQIDIIDGIFAQNKTIDPVAIEDIDTILKIDYHLMVKEPVNWVERCVRGQADRIIGQIEIMESQTEFVGKVQEVGAYVGLALDIDTPVTSVEPEILTNLDVILVMSVKAGFGGQQFEGRVIEKIKELKKVRAKDQTPFKIIVDGGVSLENIAMDYFKDVDEVAIGRRIFEGDFRENLQKFQKVF